MGKVTGSSLTLDEWTENLLKENVNISKTLKEIGEDGFKQHYSKLKEDYSTIDNMLSNENKNHTEISRELIHDIKNKYAIIDSLISLYSFGVENEEMKETSRTAGTVLENTSLSLIDQYNINITKKSPYEQFIKVEKMYDELKNISHLTKDNVNIDIKDEISKNHYIPKSTAAHIYRITHNIAKNNQRLKKGKNPVNMLIETSIKEDNVCLNFYEDSGDGIPYTFKDANEILEKGKSGNNSSGIGLYVAKELAENKIKGYFTVDRKNQDYNKDTYRGAKFELGIPRSEYLTKTVMMKL